MEVGPDIGILILRVTLAGVTAYRESVRVAHIPGTLPKIGSKWKPQVAREFSDYFPYKFH